MLACLILFARYGLDGVIELVGRLAANTADVLEMHDPLTNMSTFVCFIPSTETIVLTTLRQPNVPDTVLSRMETPQQRAARVAMRNAKDKQRKQRRVAEQTQAAVPA